MSAGRKHPGLITRPKWHKHAATVPEACETYDDPGRRAVEFMQTRADKVLRGGKWVVVDGLAAPGEQSPGSEPPNLRNQAMARRVLDEHYPFKCCAVCGMQISTCLTVAHLDHNAANNAPDNLARLCQTHHWMFDAGLYPIEAIRLLQAHWQTTQGKPDHKGRMKDAGAEAALTRKRRAAARKASETRRKNTNAKP